MVYKVALGKDVLSALLRFPCHYLFTKILHSSSWHAALTRSTNGQSQGIFQKPMLFRELEDIGQKNTFTFFLHH